MIAWASQWHCEDVQIYYYAYMEQPVDADIPASVVAHIRSCEYCQDQIAELTRIFQQLPGEESCTKRDKAWLRMIQLHFKLADQEVRCYHVRPFLPILIHPDYKIRISTPVMDHLQACSSCQQDLDALRALGLTPTQLSRLSDFFGSVQTGILPGPHLSQAELEDFSLGRIERLDKPSLNHLCLCRDCGARICQYWQELHAQTDHLTTNCSPREKVSGAEIFELVFPYRSKSDGENVCHATEPVSMQQILNDSIARDRAIEMYRVISSIAYRSDSQVVSRFDLDKAGLLEENMTWPVKEKGRTTELSLPVHPKGRSVIALGRNKSLALAAMVLLFFALVFFHSDTPVDADLSARFMQSLADTANMTITDYLPGQTDPFSTEWVAKEKQLLAVRTRRSTTVYDLKAQQSTVLDSEGRIEHKTLSDQETTFLLEHQLSTAWGVLPAVEAIPSGDKWQEQPSEASNPSATAIYELTIDRRFGEQQRWVIEVQRSTQRPIRIQKYYRDSMSKMFQQSRISEIHYGSAEEIVADIQALIPSD